MPPRSPSLGRPSATPPAGRATAIVLLATMLLVPLGIVVLGRSLAPMLDRLDALLGAVPAPRATASTRTEPGAPALRVKVVDGDGNPVVGASVRLVAFDGAPEVLQEARTNASGACGLARVATAEGSHRRARLVASRDPEGVATSGELTLDGPRDGAREVELTLSAAEAIRLAVVDSEGHPVAGAAVSVEAMPWALPPETATDSEGSLRLTTVPHEASSLLVSARGYLDAKASLASRKGSSTALEVTLRVALVLGPPVEGDVVDLDGHPVRARILACEGEPAELRATSGGDGTFKLPPAAAGCSVVAVHDSFAPSDPATAAFGRRLSLRLKAGGAIEGLVLDDRGAVIVPFTVGIETSTASRGKAVRSGGPRSFDDRGGAFKLENLAPGTYVLSASAPGKPPARSEPIEVAAGAVARGVRLVLASGGVVKGHVYDDKHAPIAGVDLSFDQVSSAVSSGAHTRTDEAGAYALEGAPSGPFTVHAEKSGFRQRLVAGLVAGTGTTITADITLAPASGGANVELGGIGATVLGSPEGTTIRSVFPGDPAERAGLRAGDLIVRIDGEPTDSMSVTDVLQRLRGEAGTTVGISVQRGSASAKETVDAVVVRAVVVH